MALKFNNCTIQNVGSLVKSKNADIDVQVNNCNISNIFDHAFILTPKSNLETSHTNFIDVRKSLVKVSSEDFFKKIGLDSDTDIKEFKDLIAQLKQSPSTQHDQIIKDSFLTNATNLTVIGANILQILPFINF